MKIVGYREPGRDDVGVGLLEETGLVPVARLDEFWRDPAAALAGDRTAAPLDLDRVELVPPVLPSARVVCIGLNYRAHAAEGAHDLGPYPTLFGRWTASLTVGGVPVPVPANEAGLDWEGEVAAFVGAPLCDVDPDTARAAIFGYSTFNDLTARHAQKLTPQWTLGKNGDRSGPMGPIVPAAEVGDLRDGLRVRTRVNGATVQDGNTADIVFEVGAVLSLISGTFTLAPGDMIATGTPSGVGYVRTPPWLLHPGDVVEVEIDKLGVLRNPITDAGGRHR